MSTTNSEEQDRIGAQMAAAMARSERSAKWNIAERVGMGWTSQEISHWIETGRFRAECCGGTVHHSTACANQNVLHPLGRFVDPSSAPIVELATALGITAVMANFDDGRITLERNGYVLEVNGIHEARAVLLAWAHWKPRE